MSSKIRISQATREENQALWNTFAGTLCAYSDHLKSELGLYSEKVMKQMLKEKLQAALPSQ